VVVHIDVTVHATVVVFMVLKMPIRVVVEEVRITVFLRH